MNALALFSPTAMGLPDCCLRVRSPPTIVFNRLVATSAVYCRRHQNQASYLRMWHEGTARFRNLLVSHVRCTGWGAYEYR